MGRTSPPRHCASHSSKEPPDVGQRPPANASPQAPVSQTLRRIIADGDYAVAEWTSHARSRSGQHYENDYAVVFHVSGGLIDAVTEYTDTSCMKRVLFEQQTESAQS